MKIALHSQPETFSKRWEVALRERGLPVARISAYEPELLDRVCEFDLYLWNWTLHDPRALTYARSILTSVEQLGVSVFPNRETCWHYDDKVAQSYLLGSIRAPIVPTHVFFDEAAAHCWLDSSEYPIVFKLRRGAGSNNVHLLSSRRDADRVVSKMFGPGFDAVPGYFADRATKLRRIRGVGDIVGRLKRLPRSIAHISMERKLVDRERGYVLFQEFCPNNTFDTRIVVIGGKAFGLRRMNRPGDFRASGSGFIDYDADAIDLDAVKIAFEVSRKLKFQCMAYDFLFDADGQPKICEISYCFTPGEVYQRCAGHWDESLEFHPGHEFLEDVIIDALVGPAAQASGGRIV